MNTPQKSEKGIVCLRVILGAVLIGFSLVLTLCPQALAADRYGVIGLTNHTQTTLNFTYREGGQSGTWTSMSIQPGEKRWFSHRYEHANEHRSPTFEIRFDSDLRGSNFFIRYTLERRAAVGQSYEQGKKYAFEYEPQDRNFIDLKIID